MTNAYCDLATLKSGGALNIAGAAYDRRLLGLLEEASRLIDGYCNRHFYVLIAARQFEIAHRPAGVRQLLVPDLVRVTEVRVARGCGGIVSNFVSDQDSNPIQSPAQDSAHPTRWRSVPWRLYPRDASPDKPWGRPHTRVTIGSAAGSVAGYDCRCHGGGAQSPCSGLVEVSGRWGYREVTEDTGAVIAQGSGMASTDTTVTVDGEHALSPGHTLAVGEEQMYVTSVAGQEITVARGVNGTLAADHEDGTSVRVYRYPGPVLEGCLQLASLLWGRRNRPGEPVSGKGNQGRFTVGLGSGVEGLLAAYRKPAV